MIETPALMANPEMRHGFFTRRGGWSTGIYESLNCGLGSNDDRATVERNRAHVATSLGLLPHQLVTAYQTHSSNVAVLDGPPAEPLRVDALVATTPGIAVGVLTADCAPVLFTDHVTEIIAAAHSGWRGALGGILEETVSAMEAHGAARHRIAAAIGPAIQQRAYEVGAEFRDRFIADDGANARFFVPSDRPDHFRFDLPGYCAMRLGRLGLAAVDVSRDCTYANERDYFSYRRATHRGEADYGRQISAITLGPAEFDAGRG